MRWLAIFLSAVAAAVVLAAGGALAQGALTVPLAWGALGGGALVACGVAYAYRREPVRWPRITLWGALAIALFVWFSIHTFRWVVFTVNDEVRVLSPNNLGDLSLHLTYIHQLTNGSSFWPENPILAGSRLAYPIGVDFFHALLVLAGMDVVRGFYWLGLGGAALTGIALWRWGGAFTLTGFLCNGGLFGFAILWLGEWRDYQAVEAWKSFPLAMLVTQRGLLFALPAGLALMSSWRERFQGAPAEDGSERPLPEWVELLLYASLPIFHLHSFLFLSLMLGAWFVLLREHRRRILLFVAAAFLPASALAALTTGFFSSPSVLGWQPGWLQADAEYLQRFQSVLPSAPAWLGKLLFWPLNFGVLPLAIGWLVVKLERQRTAARWASAVVGPALAIFLLCCFIRFAPWPWDNTKLMIWSYLLLLPFLWQELIRPWHWWARALACVALFGSGFVSLVGGIDPTHQGFAIATRHELRGVEAAVRDLPPDSRFLGLPTYNHPLLLLGRPMAMGYPGHVWSHGYDWSTASAVVTHIMNGGPGWQVDSEHLGCRYLFWGTREEEAYGSSPQPWHVHARLLAKGDWGALYDLAQPAAPTQDAASPHETPAASPAAPAAAAPPARD